LVLGLSQAKKGVEIHIEERKTLRKLGYAGVNAREVRSTPTLRRRRSELGQRSSNPIGKKDAQVKEW